VDTNLKPEAIAKVFLHTVKTIARASRSELYPLADVLGLSFVRPLYPNLNPFSYEPKFWYDSCSLSAPHSCLLAEPLLFVACVSSAPSGNLTARSWRRRSWRCWCCPRRRTC
jgi:hypothetical protein